MRDEMALPRLLAARQKYRHPLENFGSIGSLGMKTGDQGSQNSQSSHNSHWKPCTGVCDYAGPNGSTGPKKYPPVRGNAQTPVRVSVSRFLRGTNGYSPADTRPRPITDNRKPLRGLKYKKPDRVHGRGEVVLARRRRRTPQTIPYG